MPNVKTVKPPSQGEALPRVLPPFIAWDGEGITPPKPEYPPFLLDIPNMDWTPKILEPNDRKFQARARASKYTGTHSIANKEPAQDYVLFGASTGDAISAPSLATESCLDLLLRVETDNPAAIHVGFSLRYDVNMILKDLPAKKLYRIFKFGRCRWNGYYIEYRPGKWLSVNRRKMNGPSSATVKLFDVFGFFQCSFVAACESLLGKNDPDLMRVLEGKRARQSFTFDQLDVFIKPYMTAELQMMVRLMDSLRNSLLSAGIDLLSWHGAGAVASHILRDQRVSSAMAESPIEVREASRYAYAGGRFELFQCGYYKGKVWEYDIRSAYPSAMRELPNLARGSWRRADMFEPHSFGVWHVDYSPTILPESRQNPCPLFRRHQEGMVSFPFAVEGWYWTPEVELISSECVVEGWVFDEDDPTDRPFSFVGEMYETRRQWKQAGNPAQLAYKLGLNSLYGKMAQRVGGQPGKPPKTHQLEWAGYVTSATRAKIYRVVEQNPRAIVSIETDAIFSVEPLDIDIGHGLGQWEETTFDAICYLQSGFYYGWQGDNIIERYRGFDKNSVPVDRVLAHLRTLDGFQDKRIPVPSAMKLSGTTSRFIGFGLALGTSSVWRSWEINKYRGIELGGTSKRKHSELCEECAAGLPLYGGLHRLVVNSDGGYSYPHALPWVDGVETERYPWEVAPELAKF